MESLRTSYFTSSTENIRRPLLASPSQHSLRPAANMPHLWTFAATCISSLGGLLFGFDLGVVGGLLIAPSFQAHFGIDPNDKVTEAHINGTIVAVLQVGCLVGAILSTSTADKLGRKISIMIAAFVFTVGGTFQCVGYGLPMLYVGRAIAGLGVGALSMLVPIYVAEIAPQKHRGVLGGVWMFFIATGLAMSYWTNYIARRIVAGTDDALWRAPLVVQTIPGALLFFGMIPMFETPRWLCAHHHIDRARTVLAKIRGFPSSDPMIIDELDTLRHTLEQEAHEKSTWCEVFARSNRKRLLIGCAIQIFQQLTGTNVINYYSPIVFRSIGLSSDESELLATGVYGLVKMVVVLIGFSALADTCGRRPLLIGGGAAMGLCMISVAVCVATRANNTSDTNEVTASAYAGIVLMYAFAVFFALSWGPLPWIYCSEIYPMRTRAKSTSITTAVNWAMNAVIGKVSPLLLASTTFGTYLFFGIWCIIMSVFCFIVLPETKGKSLEDLDKLFNNDVNNLVRTSSKTAVDDD